MISKEELEEIKKIPGKILGNPTINKLKFVLREKGREGLERVEKRLDELGVKARFKDLKNFDWYPEWLDVLVLRVIQDEFNWDPEKMEEIGSFSARVSFVARLMMRYFVSIPRVAAEVGNYWRKYRTEGKLEAIRVSEKDKIVELKLSNFKSHPLYCSYFKGYFKQIASYVIANSSPQVEEISCPFSKGGKDHIFRITWS